MCILFLNSRVPYLSIRAARKHSFSDWRICLVFTIDIFAIYVSTACPSFSLSDFVVHVYVGIARFSLSIRIIISFLAFCLFYRKSFSIYVVSVCFLSLTTLCCLSQFFPVSLLTLLFISAFSQFITTFPWLSQLSTFFSTVSCLLRLTTIFLKSLLYLSAVYCISQISPTCLLSVSSCLFLSALLSTYLYVSLFWFPTYNSNISFISLWSVS